MDTTERLRIDFLVIIYIGPVALVAKNQCYFDGLKLTLASPLYSC